MLWIEPTSECTLNRHAFDADRLWDEEDAIEIKSSNVIADSDENVVALTDVDSPISANQDIHTRLHDFGEVQFAARSSEGGSR